MGNTMQNLIAMAIWRPGARYLCTLSLAYIFQLWNKRENYRENIYDKNARETLLQMDTYL
jgi:hypothetical protein